MNFKKYDYEIHKSLCNIGEVDEYLSECFPVGTKVRFAEKEKKIHILSQQSDGSGRTFKELSGLFIGQ